MLGKDPMREASRPQSPSINDVSTCEASLRSCLLGRGAQCLAEPVKLSCDLEERLVTLLNPFSWAFDVTEGLQTDMHTLESNMPPTPRPPCNAPYPALGSMIPKAPQTEDALSLSTPHVAAPSGRLPLRPTRPVLDNRSPWRHPGTTSRLRAFCNAPVWHPRPTPVRSASTACVLDAPKSTASHVRNANPS